MTLEQSTPERAKARRADIYRPRIGSVVLSIAVSIFLVFFTNNTFWWKVRTYLGADPWAVATLYVAVSALFIAVLTFFSVKYLIKPFLIVLVLIAAMASWFTDRFGVVVDSDMVRNVFETKPAEAQHLLTPALALHIFLFAAVPVALILWVRVVHRPILQKVIRNSAVIVACLAIFAGAAASNSKMFVGALRQHKDIVKSLNPVTPISGTVKYLMQASEEATAVVQPLGTDARLMAPVDGSTRPRVTIIVAGETARAQNFSLGGYGRDTNPELAKRDILYFPDTTSCGTATATSIPCMFSVYTRAQYSHAKAMQTETLADVLSHAGVDVAWWDNNTGSKHVADRVTYVDLAGSTDPRFCAKGECRDDIFLDKLDAWLDRVTKDSVLVLHQLGSHGPSYYLRYTDEFRRFTPDCRSEELTDCSDADIVNAYDNSLLYTDHFLATVIDRLKARSETLSTAMVYMSDHGESLGENGLYLHGAPYMFAPDTQTHVPFVLWFDPGFARSLGVEKTCMAKTVNQPRSHDNLFHSVLGMMNVSTKVYDPALDIFAGCRQGASS